MSDEPDFRKAATPLLGLLKEIEEQRARTPAEPVRDPRPCERCAGAGFVLTRAGENAVAAPCGCDRVCRICGGRGFTLELKEGYEFRQACECQTLGRRIATYNAAYLPARFAGKTFDDFKVNPDDPSPLAKAKREMREFADTARPGHTRFGKGLVGGPGRGKTHLLAAALARLTLGRGIPARYIEIGFLFADLKNAINDPRARATVDKVDELAAVDVLAIDELGKGRGSQFEEEVLDELIGRRYNTGKLTLFATNYPRVADTAARGELTQQSLRVRVGERVFSRLHEMVEFIDIPAGARDRRGVPAA
jgi:DNA replication protein DnaC